MKRIPLDGELARMKRIELSRKRTEPDLNRVKRVRRHMKPIATYAMSANNHFDPGLVRVKRQKRSPRNIKNRENPGLSRMKRFNEDRMEVQKRKRNPHRQLSKRAHKLQNILQQRWHKEHKRGMHRRPMKSGSHGWNRNMMMKKNGPHHKRNHRPLRNKKNPKRH